LIIKINVSGRYKTNDVLNLGKCLYFNCLSFISNKEKYFFAEMFDLDKKASNFATPLENSAQRKPVYKR